MKGDGIKTWWSGLSSNQKFIMILVFLIILYILYHKFKGAVNQVGINASSGGALTTLSAQGVHPSYDSETYKTWADRLEYAMDGAGTYEDIIYKIYGYLHNDADVVKLNQAFGIRKDSTLNEWLKGDLSSEAITKINAMLREEGITKTIK